MDQLQTRLEALEQQIHAVNRQLRWWRGLACSLAVVGLLGWGLPLGLAREDGAEKDKDPKGLAQRVAALENLLKHFSRKGNEVFITGANLHIRNGLGQTDCESEVEPIPDCPNGLGNLIVGYNEPRNEEKGEGPTIRTGSHNVVVGPFHNFSRFGGLVVGWFNEISGDFAVVSGGKGNTASGTWSSVSGGLANASSGEYAAVSGGHENTASGGLSAVSGGRDNTANGDWSSVSAGFRNTASGPAAAISGGTNSTASSAHSSVSGGASNTASGGSAAVSGGTNRTAHGEFDWVAGSLFEED